MSKLFTSIILVVLFFSCNTQEAEGPKKEESSNAPAQIGESKYMDWGKKNLQAFHSADWETWGSQFADNAVYSWSGGDSIKGKQSIIDYWRINRQAMMQSVSFTNDIWLPVKVNQSQKGYDAPGIWLLGWYQFNAQYRNGKSVGGWTHLTIHYDSTDKVDRIIQYIDKAPINDAAGVKL